MEMNIWRYCNIHFYFIQFRCSQHSAGVIIFFQKFSRRRAFFEICRADAPHKHQHDICKLDSKRHTIDTLNVETGIQNISSLTFQHLRLASKQQVETRAFDFVSDFVVQRAMEVINKLYSSVSSTVSNTVSQLTSLLGNPITKEYEVGEHIGSAGPGESYAEIIIAFVTGMFSNAHLELEQSQLWLHFVFDSIEKVCAGKFTRAQNVRPNRMYRFLCSTKLNWNTQKMIVKQFLRC